jgi:2-oxoglutarate ferredoxin oxidoreductase subunit beta
MTANELISTAQNTWCPGCGNFVIQHALKDVLTGMAAEGFPLENIVLVAGIGQHGKTFDFLNLNGFYSLHGRTIPVAAGIRLANPDLKVICITGDGDSYAEGLDHLIFGAKRNIDVTVLVHDNRVYGLTTGQFTPTSSHGFRGHSTPRGAPEFPLNPLDLMLSSGATFIARAYTNLRDQLKRIIRSALEHRGFSFVDILQICATYNDMTSWYDDRVYDWDESGVQDYASAYAKAREWDYNSDARIGLGVLYRHSAPIFEENYTGSGPLPPEKRAAWIRDFMDGRI